MEYNIIRKIVAINFSFFFFFFIHLSKVSAVPQYLHCVHSLSLTVLFLLTYVVAHYISEKPFGYEGWIPCQNSSITRRGCA